MCGYIFVPSPRELFFYHKILQYNDDDDEDER